MSRSRGEYVNEGLDRWRRTRPADLTARQVRTESARQVDRLNTEFDQSYRNGDIP